MATAVLAAERHRRLTGQGQLVEVSLSDVAMSMVSNLGYIAEVEINGTARKPDGNFVYGAYGDTFRTADERHVMVVAISDRQWRALVQALEVETALAAAAQALGFHLDNEQGRFDARELISACFRPWFSRRTLAEVDAALAKHPILFGVYRTFSQMLNEDPRCSERNPMFRRVDHPGIGSFLTSASPLIFGETLPLAPASAPKLGQHTARVLREWIGLGPDEVTQLATAGVIGADHSGELDA